MMVKRDGLATGRRVRWQLARRSVTPALALAAVLLLAACSSAGTAVTDAAAAQLGSLLPLPRAASGAQYHFSALGQDYLAALGGHNCSTSGTQLTFSPSWSAALPHSGLEDTAYAIFGLGLDAALTEADLRLQWASAPQAGQLWLGLSDYSRGLWQWQQLDAATLTLSDAQRYADVDGNVYAAVLLLGTSTCTLAKIKLPGEDPVPPITYPVVDTMQEQCYSASAPIAAPAAGAAFFGQDAQYNGNVASYTLSGDGLTVHDNVTGLTWMHSPDTDGDGEILIADKMTWAEMQAYPATLNAANFGDFSDWRLPTIKELYSLIDFRGTDPSGYEGPDNSGLVPFISTDYFVFDYGDTAGGERIIDSQYGSSTLYVDTTMPGLDLLFGVNFADGRIKGYGLLGPGGTDKTFTVLCVRGGGGDYGLNNFVDNGDGTVSDLATGLMWQQADSGAGMYWVDALDSAETSTLAGYDDWRLPNAKKLQSILDYTRSPGSSGSAALDPVFSATQITNEAGNPDWPSYWTSTTHINWTTTPGNAAAYFAFGRAMGYMQNKWVDVHGAGAQRSDPKDGDPADYPYGNGPQGDAIRIFNYVRCVRGGEVLQAQ